MNKFKKVYLDNGIPVYLDRDPSKKNLFFSYNVKYGSDGKWFKFNYDGSLLL